VTYSFQLTFGETLRADIGMNGYSAVQYLLFVAIVTALVSPLGGYMHRVFTRQRTVLDRLCGPAERLIYRLTPPHGYRSAVAYDAAAKTWITVGLSGTDISTDDGRNWRALRPNPALNEPADADQHWNALSLPFVVGPHGRIGKLNAKALAP